MQEDRSHKYVEAEGPLRDVVAKETAKTGGDTTATPTAAATLQATTIDGGELDGAATLGEARDKVHEKFASHLDAAVASLPGTSVAAPPSALLTARGINDLATVDYPEGIKSPSAELNVNAKHGKFR